MARVSMQNCTLALQGNHLRTAEGQLVKIVSGPWLRHGPSTLKPGDRFDFENGVYNGDVGTRC